MDLKEELVKQLSESGNKVNFKISDSLSIEIYPSSINKYEDITFFIGRSGSRKNLYILSSSENKVMQTFEGELQSVQNSGGSVLKKCPLSYQNAKSFQKYFDFTKPVLSGLKTSFGFGDRISLANPAHVRAVKDTLFFPVVAQQSIRELSRTHRTPEEVMAAAVWAIVQEGYKKGFGADADHLKTSEDIKRMVNAGYTFFTIDSGDHVVNEADEFSNVECKSNLKNVDWVSFVSTEEETIERYLGKCFLISHDFEISPAEDEVLHAMVKYCGALIHMTKMAGFLEQNFTGHPHEIEISIDETESVTTPFEHFFLTNELNRLKVNFMSLAPRFVGDFEKGIDYLGDMNVFKEAYSKHIKIAEYWGTYKISFHSGSDKFSVYEEVAKYDFKRIHVKTAGTSYLVALNVVAIVDPELFEEILKFSTGIYIEEKQTYHVSADENKIPKVAESEYPKLLDDNNVRQILHVGYGRVLTEKENNNYLFRNRIYSCLNKNEDLHYKLLIDHFNKHFRPFTIWK